MGDEVDVTLELLRGNLDLAQIGAFSDEELEAAHDAGTIYITRDQPAKALRIAGLLITLKPSEARHHRLAGLAALKLGQPQLAESLLVAAAMRDPEDVFTQLCLGEAKLLNGDLVQARTILAAAVERAGPELAAQARRARELLGRLNVADPKATGRSA